MTELDVLNVLVGLCEELVTIGKVIICLVVVDLAMNVLSWGWEKWTRS